ncbi:MAG: TetR/AcrR family transcriptional regulator [Deltaproteobacteria bacterium]|nr:TetR/AcrR family transcriptional regulator [Deltaproteobacteria bacterium]
MTLVGPSLEGKKAKMHRLIQVVGEILSEEGFQGLGVNKVAKRAGMDKVLVYRYFGGLPQLVLAFSHTVDFWPSLGELLGAEPERLNDLSPGEQMAFFFKSYLRALRRRPATINILLWKFTENNELTKQMETVPTRTALEFFEILEKIPEDRDLAAVVVLMFGAITNLLIKSRRQRFVGGIDLYDEKGWKRIEDGIDLLLNGIFPDKG